MTGNMIQCSPNMFPTFPMKYFGILNGCIVYACEVQGVKMTSSYILQFLDYFLDYKTFHSSKSMFDFLYVEFDEIEINNV